MVSVRSRRQEHFNVDFITADIAGENRKRENCGNDTELLIFRIGIVGLLTGKN